MCNRAVRFLPKSLTHWNLLLDTIGEYILQKVLDISPITTTGFCCHKISLAKVGYSKDMCPKQPKKVSHYVKILEKNCLKIKFFK